jgi:hypothetical protein
MLKASAIVHTDNLTDYRRLNRTIAEARCILSRNIGRAVTREEVLTLVRDTYLYKLPMTLADFRAQLVHILNASAANLEDVSSAKVASTRIVRKDGEYVVKAYNAQGQRMSDADYFTDDKADAEATAAHMTR